MVRSGCPTLRIQATSTIHLRERLPSLQASSTMGAAPFLVRFLGVCHQVRKSVVQKTGQTGGCRERSVQKAPACVLEK